MSRPTPETDAFITSQDYSPTGHQWRNFTRKLERERDEALEKIKQQKLEIVRLNGATSHAGGTPLKIALRERDEAREKYDTLAVENMLEVNKLCKERDETMDQLIHLRSCVYDVIHSLKAGAFDELEKAWKKGLK
jgi:hypothetical protein